MIIKHHIEPLDIPKNNKYVIIGEIYEIIKKYVKSTYSTPFPTRPGGMPWSKKKGKGVINAKVEK